MQIEIVQDVVRPDSVVPSTAWFAKPAIPIILTRQIKSSSHRSRRTDGMSPRYFDAKARRGRNGRFQRVSFTLSSILRSSFLALSSIPCRRLSMSSEQRLRAEKSSSPETSIKMCSPSVAANSGLSTGVAMRTTWAGRCGSTTAIRFPSCNVSGRIARGTIHGIRVALPGPSNYSRFFSSLPKGETQGPSTAQKDLLRSSLLPLGMSIWK